MIMATSNPNKGHDMARTRLRKRRVTPEGMNMLGEWAATIGVWVDWKGTDRK